MWHSAQAPASKHNVCSLSNERKQVEVYAHYGAVETQWSEGNSSNIALKYYPVKFIQV